MTEVDSYVYYDGPEVADEEEMCYSDDAIVVPEKVKTAVLLICASLGILVGPH